MRIAIDAHAIGSHLTGNEVYVRSFLNAFAAHAQHYEILAYVSQAKAGVFFPDRIHKSCAVLLILKRNVSGRFPIVGRRLSACIRIQRAWYGHSTDY
jgi:hypothetical protein